MQWNHDMKHHDGWHHDGCHIEPPCLTNTFVLCDLKDLYVLVVVSGIEDLIIQALQK